MMRGQAMATDFLANFLYHLTRYLGLIPDLSCRTDFLSMLQRIANCLADILLSPATADTKSEIVKSVASRAVTIGTAVLPLVLSATVAVSAAVAIVRPATGIGFSTAMATSLSLVIVTAETAARKE